MNTEFEIAMDLITAHYKNERAKRSGVRLMAHIKEGVKILNDIEATEETKAAFAIHPMLQDTKELLKNITYVASRVSTNVLVLALQYREAANAYLCREETDHVTWFALKNQLRHEDHRVLQMLYADKLQNQKDFRLYHESTHPRKEELEKYFKTWLLALDQLDAAGIQGSTTEQGLSNDGPTKITTPG